jgi:RNA polymerase sigma-70 factor (ECF subfamily)
MKPACAAPAAADPEEEGDVPAAEPAERRLDAAMERYVDGDLKAFDELYAFLAPRLYAYLFSLCKSRVRTDDLLQATFYRLHAARGSWMRGARLLPYAYAVARNAAYDDWRMRARARVVLSATGEIPDMAEPEPESGNSERATRVKHALDALPVKYREAIVLTKYHDLSIRQVALAIGVTEIAVRLRIHRGYDLLRRLLADRRS